MFSVIEAKNYKSFAHLYLDLNKNKKAKTVKNMISIYGENGSGKSSVIYLFEILAHSLHTIQTFNNLVELRDKLARNVDVEKKDINKIVYEVSKSSITRIVEDCRMIDNDDPMQLIFHFILNGKNGSYTLEFNKENQLTFEKLDYVINRNVGTIYEICYTNHEIHSAFSKSIFTNNGLIQDFQQLVDKNWGQHTFLAILNDFMANINEQFIKKHISSHLFEVIDFFEGIGYADNDLFGVRLPNKFLIDFSSGIISKDKQELLENTERVFEEFFTQIYSDIKQVKYDVREDGNQLIYQLCFYKLIEGQLRKIPYSLESHGTKKLTDILYILLSVTYGFVVVVDEIDEGIHDLMIQSVLESVTDSLKGQLIFTTHNTFLMRSFDKNSMYVIDIDANGSKSITSLDHFPTQRNHNIQSQYLKGYFGGMPYPGTIDFDEMLED
ncbi:AAA family ATPase [Enterococcus columbae]|uniref:ATPase AAA-type core domain-containing protein n=1 Tax=Enterococcus columbae DSM 7374 = ATCC 51263 TaxID=1121865 RepID=S1N3R6_9ENTE|nr:AAA family ATPase [Enterococcus columbae]EOT40472.1 hypothetical protein OMW_01334 [Enterococcus columbae DSM 7374 = ATCC 51263]EOW80248.1 hypothetical protein I568_01948 [Enterococcus columbae DSM 7374 = ATCC 51263]OJG25593.1 hypothetical protein RR47_GL001642 [Enterococcus columbae DSM 7374 = ATCC 51263]